MPGRSSIASSFLPSTSNLNPEGMSVLFVLAVLESQDDARRRGDPDFALQGRDRAVDNRRLRHGHISRQHGADRGFVQRHHDSIDRGRLSRLELEEPVVPARDHLRDEVVALKVARPRPSTESVVTLGAPGTDCLACVGWAQALTARLRAATATARTRSRPAE